MYGLGIPRLLAQLGSRLDYWRRVSGSSNFLKVFGFSRDRLSFKESRRFWSFPANLLKFRKFFVKIGEIWTKIAKNEWNFENETVKMRKCLTQFSWIFECGAVQKFVNLVHVSHFFSHSFSQVYSFFALFVQISPILTNKIRNFSRFAGKDQNLLDSQISWDFTPKIVEFSENDCRKVRKKLEKKLEVRKKSVLTQG